MISNSEIQFTKVDLTLLSTILIVSELVGSQFKSDNLFNNDWKNKSVAILLGVVLHGLLTNKISSLINNTLNTKNTIINKSVFDVFRFGTIFLSQKIIVSYIEGKPVVFDEKWLKETGLTLAGYTAFNSIESYIPLIGPYQPLMNDLIKISLGSLSAHYFTKGTIEKSELIELGSILSGFIAFHLVTKQLVTNK